MKNFRRQDAFVETADGAIELVLDRAPCNEIGSETLGELEAVRCRARIASEETRTR